MFGGKTYCTKEETGSYEKNPKLNHDTNPPGIIHTIKENTFMIHIDVNANYDANMDAEQTLNGKNNITQTWITN